jgi:hypothetical protein
MKVESIKVVNLLNKIAPKAVLSFNSNLEAINFCKKKQANFASHLLLNDENSAILL